MQGAGFINILPANEPSIDLLQEVTGPPNAQHIKGMGSVRTWTSKMAFGGSVTPVSWLILAIAALLAVAFICCHCC